MRRDAARLTEHQARLPGLATALVRHRLSEESLEVLQRLRSRGAEERASQASSLDQSALEEDLLEWLEARGVDEAWEIAATLAGVGLSEDDLEALAVTLPEEALG